MRVWLLHIGESLPVDGPARRFRYGYLSSALQDAGHEVLRWAPTFCHVKKTHRFTEDRRVVIDHNYEAQFVHSPGYERSTSLARLRAYRFLGRRFRELAKLERPPELIVAAIPSLEWADEAVAYGRENGVPVVVDVRDLWPDVFPSALPIGLQTLGRVALGPYYRLARRACRNADALCAVSKTYLDWALEKAARGRRPSDVVVPLSYEPHTISAEQLESQRAALAQRGVDLNRPACFFAGALERHHDLVTVIEAARRMQRMGRGDLQFLIFGAGSQTDDLRRQSEGLSNVHVLGWADSPMLQAAASISVIGLCAYSKGALMSLGNKPFEYMAGRLAIVSTLPGELADLLERHDCGVTCRAGDVASLVETLSRLLATPARLGQMRENAHRFWAQNYRSGEVYSRFVEHLTSMSACARAA